MKGYLNTVIVVVTVCQIAQMIVHHTESYKRIVHILCALVFLLTAAEPIRWLTENIENIKEAVAEWSESDYEFYEREDPMGNAAQAIMEHVAASCGLNPKGLKVTLVTDEETGILKEIQLYPEQCAYSDRVRISEELTELYKVRVYIYNQQE